MTTVILLLAIAAVLTDLTASTLNQLGRRLQATGRRLTKRAAGMTRARLVTVVLLAVVAIVAV